VGDALVGVEVRIDDPLDHVLDLLVKGETDDLARADAGAGIQSRIPRSPMLLNCISYGLPQRLVD
jgi:hypothetical protein